MHKSLTKSQVSELYLVLRDNKQGSSKLNKWAHRVKKMYKKINAYDDFIKENGIVIDEHAYASDEPCCYQLWDREVEGMKPCGKEGTREVKRGKYVCPEHDLFRI